MKRKESAEAIEGRYRTPEDGCANNKERRSRCIRETSNVIRKSFYATLERTNP